MTWVDAATLLFVLVLPPSLVPVLVWMERRISALIQGRLGPNRVGPFGLLQPLADAIKLLFKEPIVPAGADRFLYMMGPLLIFVPPMLGMLIVPFANRWNDHLMIGAHLPIGILFAMSVMSISVYGLAFGGWASNNKFSLLGGLRASAQMISYELALGLTIVTVIMIAGSVDPVEIVRNQAKGPFIFGWNIFGGGNPLLALSGLLAALLFYVASLAENNRAPFDLPECESELVAGYHTEYSGMKFSMFMLGEYAAMITMSSLITTLLLGGWHFPGLTDPEARGFWGGVILPFAVYMAKIMTILTVSIWIRWTLPRFRYDQLMDLGWKRLVPVALANLAVVGVVGALGG